MEGCTFNFIARHWWKRVEVWVIALLIVVGSFSLGFGASQWSLASWYSSQVTQVRTAYDEALKQRDLRLTKLADSTKEAAGKVEAAADSASKAAEKADRAAEKVNEAVDRVTP